MGEDRKKETRGRPSLTDVLQRVDDEVTYLHQELGGLPRAVEADHILREIWIDDVHNSTAIEGNTMTRAQVANLVERGRAAGTLFESAEVDAYAKAADWVYRTAPDMRGVSLDVVRELHELVVNLPWQVDPPATRDRPGSWREVGVKVGSLQVSLPPAIQADMSDWSRSTEELGANHPIVHAAIHHAWFERIHPFVDGNGRVGRLLLNAQLLQYGYPPAVILARQRLRYLQALRTADRSNPNPLAEVVARAVSDALARLLIPKLAGNAKLIPVAALAARTDYGPKYLRGLLRSGRLRGLRDGGLWLTSVDWFEDYLRNRDVRGRRGGASKRPRQ